MTPYPPPPDAGQLLFWGSWVVLFTLLSHAFACADRREPLGKTRLGRVAGFVLAQWWAAVIAWVLVFAWPAAALCLLVGLLALAYAVVAEGVRAVWHKLRGTE